MALANLSLLDLPIRVIRRPSSTIASSRTGRFADDDVATGKDREELATSFSMPRSQLSVRFEMLNHRMGESEALP